MLHASNSREQALIEMKYLLLREGESSANQNENKKEKEKEKL